LFKSGLPAFIPSGPTITVSSRGTNTFTVIEAQKLFKLTDTNKKARTGELHQPD
jgi:hypothetical protein